MATAAPPGKCAEQCHQQIRIITSVTYPLALGRAHSLLLLGGEMTLVEAHGDAGLSIHHCACDFAEATAKSTDQQTANMRQEAGSANYVRHQ